MSKASAARRVEPVGEDLATLGLAGGGFALASADIPPRMILSLEGDWGTGKSSFALSAPGPIAVINIDNNLDGVVQRYRGVKPIFVANHRISIKVAQGAVVKGDDAERAWDALCGDYRRALESRVRTVVIDNATEFWEAARLARLGKLSEVMPNQYGPVNAEFRELLRKAADADANLILIHKTKDEYVGKNRSGKRVRSGFGDMEFITQVVGRCRKATIEERGNDGTVTQRHEFEIEISKCTPNNVVTETDLGYGLGVLRGELCNFKSLAQMVFPDVDAGYWD